MLDLLLIFAGAYCMGFVLYMLYVWWKDTKTVVAIPPKVYITQVINFPDGVVTLTDKRITSPIPDISTWTEPMQELFLLIVKDWRNWKLDSKEHKYTHTYTGIIIECMGMETYSAGSLMLRRRIYRTSLDLSDQETTDIMSLAVAWKEIHYGDKLRRIQKIKQAHNERLSKEIRQKEAQQIRNYLQENGL